MEAEQGKETSSDFSIQRFEKKADLSPIPTTSMPDKLAEQVSYGEIGIRRLFSSSYVLGAAFLASLGGFSFGYDQGVISAINVMPEFHQTFPRLAPDAPVSSFWTGFTISLQKCCLPL